MRFLMSCTSALNILFGWVLPILLIPFANALSYLQVKAFEERLAWSIALSCVAVFCCYAGASKRSRTLATAMIAGWGDKVSVAATLCAVTFLAAELSANSLGVFAKLFPGEVYMASFDVMESESSRLRNAAISLKLRSKIDGNIYYLKLSKRLFDYPEIAAGDVVMLRGTRNDFGVYVDVYELKGDKPTWRTGLSQRSTAIMES